MNKTSNSGIYKIVNLRSGDCYVGSSQNLTQRKSRHFKDLRDNKHHSVYLQRAWNKYGSESFSFETIEECSPDKLLEREQYYLDTLSPSYNSAKIAGSPRGVKHSAESSNKKRVYALANNITPPESTWRDRMRPVQMLDSKTYKVLQEFECIADACRAVGKDHTYVTMITRVCNGTPVNVGKGRTIIRKTAFGYKWRFK